MATIIKKKLTQSQGWPCLDRGMPVDGGKGLENRKE
jgi:hypothetical protein